MSIPLDFGDLAREHLSMILENALDIYGLPAKVFSTTTASNGYEGLYPEKQVNATPAKSCRVLFQQQIESLNFTNNMISLSDKVGTEYVITTNVVLNKEDEVHISFPDNRRIRMRIVAPRAFNPLTQMLFNYQGVAV